MHRAELLRTLALIVSLASVACGPGVLAGEASAAPAPEVPAAERSAEAEAWARGVVRVVAADVERALPREALGALVRRSGQDAARAFDPARAWGFLGELAAEIDRAPAPGAIDLARRLVTPHVEGRTLRVDASLAELERALLAGDDAIVLEVERALPAEGVVPEGLELGAVLGEYSTRFDAHGRYRTRAHNVRLAAAALHGAVLPAGGTLSFNEVVGPRELRRGYKLASVILQGELVPGVGGGVCQAASTFHAAAFFAGLEFPVYVPHSRPSAYVPAGLDATVAFPDVDLVARNPFDFPVAVAVEAAEDTVTVRILGREKPRHVELARELHRGEPYETRDVEDPALPMGERQLTQEGARGSIVLRTRVLVEAGRTWIEHHRLEYPATDEIFHVGTGPAAPAPDAIEPSLAVR